MAPSPIPFPHEKASAHEDTVANFVDPDGNLCQIRDEASFGDR